MWNYITKPDVGSTPQRKPLIPSPRLLVPRRTTSAWPCGRPYAGIEPEATKLVYTKYRETNNGTSSGQLVNPRLPRELASRRQRLFSYCFTIGREPLMAVHVKLDYKIY
jgi:hypothetical protein